MVIISSRLRLFVLVVFDGGLDGVFSKHGAVELDRGQLQVGSNVLIFDLHGVLDSHTFEELGSVGA